MEMHILSKKGLSLIEVVVALSVLMVVFSGTVTLIIAVVNLSVSAREKTEATTYAQKALAEGIRKIDYGCVKEPPEGYTQAYGAKPYTAVIQYEPVSEANSNFEPSDDADFIRVTSIMNWKDKFGNDQEYKLTQMVGKN